MLFPGRLPSCNHFTFCPWTSSTFWYSYTTTAFQIRRNFGQTREFVPYSGDSTKFLFVLCHGWMVCQVVMNVDGSFQFSVFRKDKTLFCKLCIKNVDLSEHRNELVDPLKLHHNYCPILESYPQWKLALEEYAHANSNVGFYVFVDYRMLSRDPSARILRSSNVNWQLLGCKQKVSKHYSSAGFQPNLFQFKLRLLSKKTKKYRVSTKRLEWSMLTERWKVSRKHITKLLKCLSLHNNRETQILRQNFDKNRKIESGWEKRMQTKTDLPLPSVLSCHSRITIFGNITNQLVIHIQAVDNTPVMLF